MQNIKHGQSVISKIIKEDIIRMTGSESKYNKLGLSNLNSAIKDALTSGKRIRSIITGSINNWQNNNYVLFIEYLHTASLVMNDFKSMENIHERRKMATLHIKYDEQTALIVHSLLMSNAMYHITIGNLTLKQPFIIDKLSELINTAIGTTGMCGGQYLHMKNDKVKSLSEREQRQLILDTIKMKSGCIFGLAFVLGWIMKGENISIENMNEINSAGCDLGICYYIIEDLRKISEPHAYDNICSYYSHNDIIDIFTEKISSIIAISKKHDIFNFTIKEIVNYMTKKFLELLPSDSRK